MATINGLFPRAPSVYGREYVGEKEHILDLVHNTYRHCYFKDCEIIIAETLFTNIQQSLLDCQFDDCAITIIKREVFETIENRLISNPQQRKQTPIACHIDVMTRSSAPKNLITCWLDESLKEKLGMSSTVRILKDLARQGEIYSGRFR